MRLRLDNVGHRWNFWLSCLKLNFFLVSVFYTVSPELANGIAKAIGWNQPIEPLEVKSSAQAIAFRHNIGVSADSLFWVLAFRDNLCDFVTCIFVVLNGWMLLWFFKFV